MFDPNRSSYQKSFAAAANDLSITGFNNDYGFDQSFSVLGKRHASSLDNSQFSNELSVQIQGLSRAMRPGLNRVEPNLPRRQSGSQRDSLTGLGSNDVWVTGRPTTQITHRVEGRLSRTDDLNPTRPGTYKDDYLLDIQENGRVQLNLDSTRFDTYLQVLDSRTGQVIAEDDDSGPDTNSQLTLNTQAGVDYILRVTSFAQRATGSYILTGDMSGSTPPNPPDPGQFNPIYGYGLVNAASAVARAINSSPFAAVPDLGGNNWGNDMVNAPESWARGYTGRGVTVAVVDTGVDFNHVDLRNNIWTNTREIANNGIDDDRNGYIDDVRGWNFAGNNSNTMDDQSHGTHVAGTIAAANDGAGITGVAYDAKIMPVKVLGRNGSGSSESVAGGIRYAADNGADVINLSLGSDSPSGVIEQAVRYATERGAVVVMAAGNDGAAAPGYPARYATQFGLSVGSVTNSRVLSSFSNRAGSDSQLQHVVAPGSAIYSTIPGNRYATYSGTSMATPHVAGVAALMLSANPNLSPAQVRQILTGSATSLR